MRQLFVACAVAMLLAASPGVGWLQPPGARAAHDGGGHDYNGDGVADLAIGIPGETVGGNAGAGAVQILYGAAGAGFSSSRQQFIHENVLANDDGAQAGDGFGSALVSANFDQDGFDDLAIGIPGEDAGGLSNRGAVMVLWGSNAGLVEAAANRITGPEQNSRLGASLAALDFYDAEDQGRATPDGVPDIVISIRGNEVILKPGGPRNFLGFGTFAQNIDFVANPPDAPLVLAGGQLDTDPAEELIAGLPQADGQFSDGTVVADAGRLARVDNLGGGHSVLTTSQESHGLQSAAGDNFGAAIVIAQLFGSPTSAEELIVGAPGENVMFNGAVRDDAGAAHWMFAGTTATITQASPDVPENPEVGDRFGSSLVVGDFDGGATAILDVAYGVPGDQIGSVDAAGAVIVQRGAPGTATYQLLHQNGSGVPGAANANDRFGAVLAAGNYDDTGAWDLAVGVPLENQPSGVSNAGALNMFYAGNAGTLIVRNNDPLWTQAVEGIPSNPGRNDKFGAALE